MTWKQKMSFQLRAFISILVFAFVMLGPSALGVFAFLSLQSYLVESPALWMAIPFFWLPMGLLSWLIAEVSIPIYWVLFLKTKRINDPKFIIKAAQVFRDAGVTPPTFAVALFHLPKILQRSYGLSWLPRPLGAIFVWDSEEFAALDEEGQLRELNRAALTTAVSGRGLTLAFSYWFIPLLVLLVLFAGRAFSEAFLLGLAACFLIPSLLVAYVEEAGLVAMDKKKIVAFAGFCLVVILLSAVNLRPKFYPQLPLIQAIIDHDTERAENILKSSKVQSEMSPSGALDIKQDIMHVIETADPSLGATPLMWAARFGNLQVIYEMIKRGAKFEAKDKFNRGIYFYADLSPHPEETKEYLKSLESYSRNHL
jgi:hypothetical protein